MGQGELRAAARRVAPDGPAQAALWRAFGVAAMLTGVAEAELRGSRHSGG